MGSCGSPVGLYVAVTSSLAIRLDRRQRIVRNLVFEHTVGETVAMLATAWVLTPVLDHLTWQKMTWYSASAVLSLAVVHLVTRRSIRGEEPGELFA